MAAKILKILKNIFFVLIICFSIIYILINVGGLGKKGYIPRIGPYKFMSVLSGSMKPAFNPGDAIVVRDVDPESLKTGDVITFRHEGSLTTHRIVEVAEKDGMKFFRTKGDNNNTNDIEPVKSIDVVGKYIFHIPLIGYLFVYIKGPIGILIIWVLIIYILASEIHKKIKEKKNFVSKNAGNSMREN